MKIMNAIIGLKNIRISLILMSLLMVFASCKTASYDGAETEYDLLKKGYKRVVMKDYKGAVLIYTKILDFNPENAEALAYRGLCKYHLKDFEGAIIDFNRAILHQPDYAEVYDLRGIAKGELGDKEGACEDWKKSFELGFKGAFMLIKEFCWEE